MGICYRARLVLGCLVLTSAAVSAQAPVEPVSPEAILTSPCASPAPPPPPPSYAGPFCERGTLTGNWFGCRDKIRDCGFTFDISATNFFMGVTEGGLSNAWQNGGRADIYLNINGEKAGLWKGFFIDLHNETLYGDSINTLTGALSPVSIGQYFPVPNGPVNALTAVKFTQALSESFVLFAGKLNTVDGFYQPFAGGRGVDSFFNINFCFNPILARTLPYSTFGGGFAVLREGQPVFSAMVLDTNNTPTTTGFPTFFDNGSVIVGQANIPTSFLGKSGHQGLMGSYSNRKFNSLEDLPYLIATAIRPNLPPPAQQTGSWTVAYMFDQTIGTVCCDAKRAWGLFGNAGISDGNPNPIRWNANIGLGGASPFASRPLDSFGIGYFYLGLSDEVRNFAPRLLPLRDEQGVEAFYTIGVTPWCKVTADFQVVEPARSRVDTDVIFGVRAKINF